jgi:heptaprenylglyceryl phosphate synthase
MKNIYLEILNSKKKGEKLLAILIDPDKIQLGQLDNLIEKINQSPATHVFVGGSLVETNLIDVIIKQIKQDCNLPILLFPGSPSS